MRIEQLRFLDGNLQYIDGDDWNKRWQDVPQVSSVPMNLSRNVPITELASRSYESREPGTNFDPPAPTADELAAETQDPEPFQELGERR